LRKARALRSRSAASRYFAGMGAPLIRADGFVAPCIPTLAAKPPAGPDLVHEIEHDGYRLIVRLNGRKVRLFTRRGHDWTDRYPTIAAAAAKLRAKSFDGRQGGRGTHGRPARRHRCVAALTGASGNQGLDPTSKSRRGGPSPLQTRLLQQNRPIPSLSPAARRLASPTPDERRYGWQRWDPPPQSALSS
jgi:hypothetical protein